MAVVVVVVAVGEGNETIGWWRGREEGWNVNIVYMACVRMRVQDKNKKCERTMGTLEEEEEEEDETFGAGEGREGGR